MKRYRIPRIAVPVLLFLTACAGVDMSSVVDTQFLMTNRDLPLQNLLVVYDSRDLALKDDFEMEFASYLRENAEIKVHRDIDLFTPLKNMTDKEKVWALKDASIDGVIYMNGGLSGRPLREWLYPEAPELDTKTPAWTGGTIKLFLPRTAQVVWVGNVSEAGGMAGEELNTRGFFSAVTLDLVRRGIIAQPRDRTPGLRGFNR